MLEFAECGRPGFYRAISMGFSGNCDRAKAITRLSFSLPGPSDRSGNDVWGPRERLPRTDPLLLHSDSRVWMYYGGACWSSSRLYPPISPIPRPHSPVPPTFGGPRRSLSPHFTDLGARELRDGSVGPVPASVTYQRRAALCRSASRHLWTDGTRCRWQRCSTILSCAC